MGTTTARGLLMLSPRLMLTMAITTAMDWPTTGTDTLTMATTATLMLITMATTTKRSADAEPAADAYYGHHYGYGLAHHGYGYAHHGYYGYPYAHHGYYGYHH